MESSNNFVLTLTAYIVVGGMLFMFAYITFSVIRGAIKKPKTGADAASPGNPPQRTSPLLSNPDQHPPG